MKLETTLSFSMFFHLLLTFIYLNPTCITQNCPGIRRVPGSENLPKYHH